MYVTSAWSVVYALDAKTGEELWVYDPDVDRAVGVNACCDVVNRGVAVYDGKLYLGVIDGRVEALDAKTGDVIWSTVTVDQSKPYTITGAPRVVDGKVRRAMPISETFLAAEPPAMSDPSIHENELPQLPTEAAGRCCRFNKALTSGFAVAGLTVITVVATTAAGYFAGRASEAEARQDKFFPPIEASAAVSSEKFSMATGFITDRAEGLFVLDHNSGLLQCSVIYPRLGKFLGLYTANVGEALSTGGKGGRYMMVTGLVDFPSSNNRPAASSCIYVLDTATGNYACYGIPFDRVKMNANRAQQGALVLISTGTANPVIDRDALN